MTAKEMRKALVVDDNARWLETLSRLASHLDYEVLAARNLAQAQEKAKEYQYPLDLVITDIRLEDHDPSNIDGIILLQRLRSSGQLRASIVVTGYPSEETRQLTEQIGSSYLVKGRFTRKDFADTERTVTQQLALRSADIGTGEISIALFEDILRFLRKIGFDNHSHGFPPERPARKFGRVCLFTDTASTP